MAAGRRTAAPPPPQVKDFTPEEIDQGIALLKRRVEEVKALDPNRIQYEDQKVRTAEQNIRTAILEIFGPHSLEYLDHQSHTIWHATTIDLFGDRSDAERHQCFVDGIPDTVAMLEGLIAKLEERMSLTKSPATRARAAFEGLELHPRIAMAASDLFRDGHYRNAVLDACLALGNYVKDKSGQHSLDGVNLMRTVFSVNKPVVAFNALEDQSDRDEQEGLMHLFEGVALAFRNPRAHDLDADSPEDATEYLAFLSLLAKKLDKARRVMPQAETRTRAAEVGEGSGSRAV